MKKLIFPILFFAATSLIAQEKNVKSPSLPQIGKFMLVKQNNEFLPAFWLGAEYKGRILHEPINIIIQDSVSSTESDAQKKLLEACQKAGFPQRKGHSSGYFAQIDKKTIPQFFPIATHAFSDAPYEINNNHGRIFGPYPFKGKYFFIAAFSREDVSPLQKIKHQYNSFNRARDRFAESMDENTLYKKVNFINIDNAIIQSNDLTTGDHDGIALLLESK